jgi:hypothetical protein
LNRMTIRLSLRAIRGERIPRLILQLCLAFR